MTNDTKIYVHPAEVRRAIQDVRRLHRECSQALDRNDLDRAYEYAERAQMAAFDVKDLIRAGGKYSKIGNE